jgi:hypothetical protein
MLKLETNIVFTRRISLSAFNGITLESTFALAIVVVTTAATVYSSLAFFALFCMEG